MIKPELIYKGSLNPEDIIIEKLTSSSLRLSKEDSAIIESDWQLKKQVAIDKNRKLWNAYSHRLESLKALDNQKIVLRYSLLEYKIRDGMMAIPNYFEREKHQWQKGVFLGATVRTSDNMCLYLELSGRSFNNNRYELIGGILEPDKSVENGQEIFNEMLVELEEEALISKVDVKEVVLNLIYFGSRTNIGMHFDIELRSNLADVINNFNKGNPDTEVKNLLYCETKDWKQVLESMSENKQFIARELF